jgi:hypothetical protein
MKPPVKANGKVMADPLVFYVSVLSEGNNEPTKDYGG